MEVKQVEESQVSVPHPIFYLKKYRERRIIYLEASNTLSECQTIALRKDQRDKFKMYFVGPKEKKNFEKLWLRITINTHILIFSLDFLIRKLLLNEPTM